MGHLGMPSNHISPGRAASTLRVALLSIPAVLLFIPVLWYSLTTPFALIDDYWDWTFVSTFDSAEHFFEWLHRNFLGSHLSRYRPFWEFYNAVAWKVFGPTTPSLHHLSRWVFHFGGVFMFTAAFLCFSRNERTNDSIEPGIAERLLPILPLSLLVYVWLFFPNSPASRMSPQEVYTVFFLGLCNWMAALFLTEGDKERRRWSTLLKYGLFCLGCIGLSMSKEINVAVVLWIAVSYYALLVVRRQGRVPWKRILGGVPLVLLLLLTFHRVYAASRIAGIGYSRETLTWELFSQNALRIGSGLLQDDTSLLITASLAILSAVVLFVVVNRIVRRGLDDELLFTLFLIGQFASMFVVLSSSWGVALRYWYILIPVFATLLAFSAKLVLEAARARSKILTYVAMSVLASLVMFFVAANYYNFLFQTIVQHSLRHTESEVLSEVKRLLNSGEYVQIQSVDSEYRSNFKLYYDRFLPRFERREYTIHTTAPSESGRRYYLVKQYGPQYLPDAHVTIAARQDYNLLSHARKVGGFVQRRPPNVSLDHGVANTGTYRWTVYRVSYNIHDYWVRLIEEAGDPRIRSTFDVYSVENRVIYFKEPCVPADTEATFFLHLAPADQSDLPDHSRRYGFDNLDFRFHLRGERFNGRCIATVTLPDYRIDSIRTGQHTSDGLIWEADFPFK